VDYVNTFLKLKSEASGYPGWIRSPEDEERYFESFWKSEGIRLDKESIKTNEAKRYLAKICLNSMYGKLTERNDRAQAKFISEPKELYRFLATPGIEVMNLMFASDDVVWVSWKYAAEKHVSSLRHTNEVTAITSPKGLGFIYTAILTDCKRKQSIAILILSNSFSRETNPSFYKRGTNWET